MSTVKILGGAPSRVIQVSKGNKGDKGAPGDVTPAALVAQAAADASARAAGTHASDAADAAASAGAHASDAVSAASIASAKAGAATDAANAAAGSASTSTGAAGTASDKAGAAAVAAQTATDKASAAGAAASTATGAASTASDKALAAAGAAQTATDKAGAAAGSATTAGTQAAAAGSSATQAAGSASTASAAAAAALTNGQVYGTPALGLAAVADGAYFDVVGDGTTTARLRYQRTNSTTYTGPILSYPAGALVAANTTAIATNTAGLTSVSSTVNNLGSVVSVADDTVWAQRARGADGNVVFGIDQTGKTWAWILQVVQQLIVNNASIPALASELLSIGSKAGVAAQISEADTQYSIQVRGADGYVIGGLLNGQWVFPTSGGSPDSIARKFDRMFGRGCILPNPIASYRPGSTQNLLQGVGENGYFKMVAIDEIENIQAVCHNWRTQSDTAPNNSIRFGLAIEFPFGSGTWYLVYFSDGAQDGSTQIMPHQYKVNLPLGLHMTKGSYFGLATWLRTDPDFTSGATGSYPVGGIGTAATAGVDKLTQNTTTDMRTTGQSSPTTSDTYCYLPLAICGARAVTTLVTTQIFSDGDSIDQGAGGAANWAGGKEGGILEQACQAAGVGYINSGANGIQLRDICTPAQNLHRSALARSCSAWFNISGTNDLAADAAVTLATMQSRMLSKIAVAKSCGKPFVPSTIPPRTTNSNNNFTTTTGQTALNSNFGPEGANGSLRKNYNKWLLSLVAAGTVDAVYDLGGLAEVYEPSTDTYVWKVGANNTANTADGIHPAAPFTTSTLAPAVAATGLFLF